MSSFFKLSDWPTFRVAAREWRRLLANRITLRLIVILPPVLFVLFALIYMNGVARQLPVAIIDMDHSALSRSVTQAFSSTRSFKLVSSLNSLEEAEESMRAGEIQAAFYIPASFTADIKSGIQTRIVVYKNTSNMIIGNLVLKDAVTIVRTICASKLIKSAQARGMTPEQAYNSAVPIRVESSPLFNPAYNYASFLIPGLVTVMLHMIIMIVAILVMNTEYHERTFGELMATAGGSIPAVLVGKSLPYLAFHIATVFAVVGILFPIFGILIQGSMLATLAYLIFFVIVSFFIGLALSCVLRDRLFATELVIVVSTPAFVLSGYTYPIWAMPVLFRGIAYAFPFTHFLAGFIQIYQMGVPASYLWPHVGVLSLYLAGSLMVSATVLADRRRNLPGLDPQTVEVE